MDAESIDWDALSDEQVQTLRERAGTVLSARREAARIPETIDDMLRKRRGAEGAARGDEWQAPDGAHDAYPMGWEVTYDGATWISLVHGNVWRPGESGWREVVAEDEAPALWVQPTGAHDAYQKGDRVTHDEAVWVSIIDANVWPPSVHGWEKEK